MSRQSDPRGSYSGPWLVRVLVNPPGDLPRAIDPIVCSKREQIAQALSGITAALTLTLDDAHVEISIDPGGGE